MLDTPKGEGQPRQAESKKKPRRRRRGGDKGGHARPLYAAIDLGTNCCRLLIVERAGTSFRVRDSFSRIVRLGEGLEASGQVTEEAMERTIAALRICAGKIRRAKVKRMRCVATEACRDAQNGEEFIRRIRRETGLSMEVIDGHTEAELAAIGCGSLFDETADNIILFDIGGGSTEVTRLDRQPNGFFEMADSASLPLGVVRLAERHSGPGPYEHGYEEMLAESRERLRAFMDRQDMITDMSKLQIIGTSGTVTTLAAVQLGLARYDRTLVDGCTIASTDIRKVIDDLRARSRDELAANLCIGPERADLVLAGCAVLDVIYEQWPVEQFSVADRGLREGILLRLIRQDKRRRRRSRRRGGGQANAQPMKQVTPVASGG
jgi:exopolyphosphatase/guanosine-5'-triphosphate,3'-diphosphate pyrophosphatase